MKSVLYARVSTMEEFQNNSYEQQQLYRNDNFDIVKVFSDKASGGNVDKRENFLQMLEYCGIKKEGNNYSVIAASEIECIIVANVSRFSRSIVDARLIIEALHKNDIKVYFIDLNKYSDDSDIFLTLNMFLVIEEEYLRNVSSKVKAGMQRKIETGYILNGGKVIGYDYIKKEDGKGYLIPHPIESLMVKGIFKDYIKGMGTRAIGSKYKLSSSTILGIIKNKKYCGYMGYNLKSDPIYIKSEFIEPLISESAFNEVQQLRKARCNSDSGKGRRIPPRALTSKIICSCGSKYHYKGEGKDNATKWVCSNNSIEGRTKGCGSKQFHTRMIIPYLQKNIEQIEMNLEFQLNKEISEINSNSYDGLEKRKEEIETQLDKLLDLFLTEETDSRRKESYKRKEKLLLEELKEVDDKLTILKNMDNHIQALNELRSDYKAYIEEIKQNVKDNDLNGLEKRISTIELKTVVNIFNFKEELKIDSIKFSCFNEVYNTNFFLFEDMI
ncbi:MAG: recombinase family protein [Clostridium sp.]